MSTEYDNRVVRMEMQDTKKFQKDVNSASESLERLKKDLNFDEEAESFKRVEKASKDLDFRPLESQISGLKRSFSALEVAGITVISRITNRLIDMTERFVKSVTIDNVIGGWQKYENQLKATQTIMAGLSKDVRTTTEELKLMNEVSDKLKKLSWYADETSFYMDQMTSGVSKLVAKGHDLDTAETAIMGISNWTAIAGQNASTASTMYYQLSQALGSYMKYQDWMSVKNANMDIKPIRDLFLETAAAMEESEQTIRKEIDETDGTVHYFIKNTAAAVSGSTNGVVKLSEALSNTMEITDANFEQTLTSGKWLTSKVMIEAFKNLGNFAMDLRTNMGDIEDQLDAVGEASNDSISSVATWKKAIQTIIDAEEELKTAKETAGETFTQDDIHELFWTRDSEGNLNAQIQNAIGMFGELGLAAEMLEDDLKSLTSPKYNLSRSSFFKAFEATTLTDAIEAVKENAKTSWMNIFQDIVGNYVEAREEMTSLADTLINTFVSPIWTLQDAFDQWSEEGYNKVFIEGLKELANAIGTWAAPIKNAFNDVFNINDETIFEVLVTVTNGFKNFASSLKLSEGVSETFTKIWSMLFKGVQLVGKAFDAIGPSVLKVVGYIADVIGAVFEAINDMLNFEDATDSVNKVTDKASKALDVFKNAFSGVASMLSPIASSLGQVATAIGNLISSVASSPVVVTLIETVSNAATKLLNLLELGFGFIGYKTADAIRAAEATAEDYYGSTIGYQNGVVDATKDMASGLKAAQMGIEKDQLQFAQTMNSDKMSPKFTLLGGVVDDGDVPTLQEQVTNEQIKSYVTNTMGGSDYNAIAVATGFLKVFDKISDGLADMIDDLSQINFKKFITDIMTLITDMLFALNRLIWIIIDGLQKLANPKTLVTILAIASVLVPIIAGIVAIFDIIGVFTGIGHKISGGLVELNKFSGSLAALIFGLVSLIAVVAWVSRMVTEDPNVALNFKPLIEAFYGLILIVTVCSALLTILTKGSRGLTMKAPSGLLKGLKDGNLEANFSEKWSGGFDLVWPILAFAVLLLAFGQAAKMMMDSGVLSDDKAFGHFRELIGIFMGWMSIVTILVVLIAAAKNVFNTGIMAKNKMNDIKDERSDSGIFAIMVSVALVIASLSLLLEEINKIGIDKAKSSMEILFYLALFVGIIALSMGAMVRLSKTVSKYKKGSESESAKFSTSLGSATAALVVIMAACAGMIYALSQFEDLNPQTVAAIGDILFILGSFMLAIGVVFSLIFLAARLGENNAAAKSETLGINKLGKQVIAAAVALTVILAACAGLVWAVSEFSPDLSDNEVASFGIMLGAIALLLAHIAGLLFILANFTNTEALYDSTNDGLTTKNANHLLRASAAITLIMGAIAGFVWAISLVKLDKDSIGPILGFTAVVTAIMTHISGVLFLLGSTKIDGRSATEKILASAGAISMVMGVLAAFIWALSQIELTKESAEAISDIMLVMWIIILAVGGAIALVAGWTRNTEKSQSSALKAAAAITLVLAALAGIMYAVSYLPFDTLGDMGVLAVVAGALVILSNFLGMVVTSLILVSNLIKKDTANSILQAAGSMSAIMLALVGVLAAMAHLVDVLGTDFNYGGLGIILSILLGVSAIVGGLYTLVAMIPSKGDLISKIVVIGEIAVMLLGVMTLLGTLVSQGFDYGAMAVAVIGVTMILAAMGMLVIALDKIIESLMSNTYGQVALAFLEGTLALIGAIIASIAAIFAAASGIVTAIGRIISLFTTVKPDAIKKGFAAVSDGLKDVIKTIREMSAADLARVPLLTALFNGIGSIFDYTSVTANTAAFAVHNLMDALGSLASMQIDSSNLQNSVIPILDTLTKAGTAVRDLVGSQGAEVDGSGLIKYQNGLTGLIGLFKVFGDLANETAVSPLQQCANIITDMLEKMRVIINKYDKDKVDALAELAYNLRNPFATGQGVLTAQDKIWGNDNAISVSSIENTVSSIMDDDWSMDSLTKKWGYNLGVGSGKASENGVVSNENVTYNNNSTITINVETNDPEEILNIVKEYAENNKAAVGGSAY